MRMKKRRRRKLKVKWGFEQMLSFCGLGYWVSGFRCFPWLALNIHMAQNLNMNPSTLQMVQNFGNLPMVAKPIYGVISDALYIGGAAPPGHIEFHMSALEFCCRYWPGPP